MKKSFPYTRQFAQVGKPLRVHQCSLCRETLSAVANGGNPQDRTASPPQVVHRLRNCLPYTPFSSQNLSEGWIQIEARQQGKAMLPKISQLAIAISYLNDSIAVIYPGTEKLMVQDWDLV